MQEGRHSIRCRCSIVNPLRARMRPHIEARASNTCRLRAGQSRKPWSKLISEQLAHLVRFHAAIQRLDVRLALALSEGLKCTRFSSRLEGSNPPPAPGSVRWNAWRLKNEAFDPRNPSTVNGEE